MLRYLMQNRVLRTLRRVADTPFLPVVASLLALALTLSMTVPVTTALVPAVLLAPRRWRRTVILSSAGSAIGATILVIAFHHLGWQQVYTAFPEFARSARWQEVAQFTRAYGVFALFVVAALPLPQTPALILCAISRLPELEVMVAILAGKLIKYGVVGGVAVVFPERFQAIWAALNAGQTPYRRDRAG
jgi:membrane protein YqaA with SNARE-associated domain